MDETEVRNVYEKRTSEKKSFVRTRETQKLGSGNGCAPRKGAPKTF